MKQSLLLLVLLLPFAAKAQDTVTIYLTTDLWVNSCLLVWEETEQALLQELNKGKLPLYDFSSGNKRPLKDYSRALRYAVPTLEGDSTDLPVERLFLRTGEGQQNSFFQVLGQDQFTGDTLRIGWLDKKDLFSMIRKNRPVLELLSGYTGIFGPGQWISPSHVYVHSVLLADSLAKRLHHLARYRHSVAVFGSRGEKYTDSLIDEQISLHGEVVEEDGSYRVVKGWVDEQDRWKGLVLQSSLGGGKLLHHRVGVLYHARTKYAGFDPGYMPWFFVPVQDLKKAEPGIHGAIQVIGDNALKYLADRDRYLSTYFREANIRINNSRYPYH